MNREDEEYMTAWRRQLIREHQNICDYYGVELPTPMLSLGVSRGKAGSWQATPAPGIVQINDWLVREHGWEVVLEILKHEMSHQYVDQILGRGHEPPHGPAFQEACNRLGVHPLFRRSQGEIPRFNPDSRRADHNNPMIARIEKLLALASSANEHEAALAMSKAGELMRRHNLQKMVDHGFRTPDESGHEYDFLVIASGRQRHSRHQIHLAALLQEYFYVRTINYSLYDPKTQQEQRVLELLGRRENLEVAEYVYHFMEDQLARLWRIYKSETRAGGREKNSFYLGLISGFREKLQQQERGAVNPPNADTGATSRGGREDIQPATCSSLVCAKDTHLQEFIRNRYPRLRTARSRGGKIYRDSFQAGTEEGRKIVLHKGVHHQSGNLGKLLPK